MTLPIGLTNLMASANAAPFNDGFAHSWTCATLIALGIFSTVIQKTGGLLLYLPVSYVNDSTRTAVETMLLATKDITFEPIVHTGMLMAGTLDLSTMDATHIIVYLNPVTSEMHIYSPFLMLKESILQEALRIWTMDGPRINDALYGLNDHMLKTTGLPIGWKLTPYISINEQYLINISTIAPINWINLRVQTPVDYDLVNVLDFASMQRVIEYLDNRTNFCLEQPLYWEYTLLKQGYDAFIERITGLKEHMSLDTFLIWLKDFEEKYYWNTCEIDHPIKYMYDNKFDDYLLEIHRILDIFKDISVQVASRAIGMGVDYTSPFA